jgi:hypothetical protein
MVSREGRQITRIEVREILGLALKVTLSLDIWDKEFLHGSLEYGTDSSGTSTA